MLDRMKRINALPMVLWAFAAAGALMGLAGCSSGYASWKPYARTQDKNAPAQTFDETATTQSTKFAPAKKVSPADAEAFENAVERINRLEYAKAETEIRQLLVRFESVDDPRYTSRALFWLGYCCEKQGAAEQAQSYYQRVAGRYPDTRPGELARQRLGYLAEE
mgnify:CR=1 FL=1